MALTGMGRKRRTRTSRAGLVIPVGRAEAKLRVRVPHANVSPTAAVAVAAVVEYALAEVIELAGNAAKDDHRVRITCGNVRDAIHGDDELRPLLATIDLGEGFARPTPLMVARPIKVKGAGKAARKAKAAEPAVAAADE